MKKLYAILMILIISLTACQAKEDEKIPELKEPVSGQMDTAVVSRGNIYTLTTYDGKVYPDIQDVSFTVDGNVKNIAVSLGQKVEKGDILISLDDTRLKERLEELKNSLDDSIVNNEYSNIERDLDYQLSLIDMEEKIEKGATELEIAMMEADLEKREIMSSQALQMAELNFNKMHERINELEEEIKKTTIVAPCSGHVVYLADMRVGDRVIAEDPVVIITDESKLHLQTDYINRNDISSASRIYALHGGNSYDIEYQYLNPEEALRLNDGVKIESKFSFDVNDEFSVGDYVTICLEDNFKENVLTVPNNSLYNDSRGYFVYRLIDDELVRADVETGIVTDTQVEIISGLKEGDVVYVQG